MKQRHADLVCCCWGSPDFHSDHLIDSSFPFCSPFLPWCYELRLRASSASIRSLNPSLSLEIGIGKIRDESVKRDQKGRERQGRTEWRKNKMELGLKREMEERKRTRWGRKEKEERGEEALTFCNRRQHFLLWIHNQAHQGEEENEQSEGREGAEGRKTKE